MREMKDSGVTWIGEIPDKWNLLPVKRFFRAEKRIVGDAVNEYERLALTMKGVIKRSKDDNEGLQPEKFEGYQILRENELVFKLIDLENVKTSRVGLSPYTGLVSPAYIVLSNRKKDNRFYYYWFLCMYYTEVFNQLGGAGVRSALTAKDVCLLPVPTTDEDEQTRIADYLDDKCSKIDTIIAKQEKIIEKLKEYKSSYLNEQFNKKEQKSTTCHVGFLGKMKNGLNFSDTVLGNEIKILGVGDFKENYYLNRLEQFSTVHLDDMVDADYYLKDEDIVFVRSNGSKELVGRAVMVENINFPLVFSGFCIRFRNSRSDIIDSKYLLYFFRSPDFRKELEKYSYGSNISNMNQALLSQIAITFPSLDEQRKAIKDFETKMFAINSAIYKRAKISEMLLQYKKSLIYECVTGKKDIM